MPRPTHIIFVFSIILFVGCASHHVERGDRLAARGQHGAAISAYEVALREDPDDEATRRKLEEAQRRLIAEYRRRAEDALSSGDLERAIEVAAEASSHTRQIPGARKLVRRVCDDIQEASREAMTAGDYAAAFDPLRFAVEQLPAEGCGSQRLEKVRTVWAGELDRRARAAADQGLKMSAALYRGKAALLLDDEARLGDARRTYDDAVKATRFEVVLVQGNETMESDEVFALLFSSPTPPGLHLDRAEMKNTEADSAKFSGPQARAEIFVQGVDIQQWTDTEMREHTGRVFVKPAVGDGIPTGCQRQLVDVGAGTGYVCHYRAKIHHKNGRLPIKVVLSKKGGESTVHREVVEKSVTDVEHHYVDDDVPEDPYELPATRVFLDDMYVMAAEHVRQLLADWFRSYRGKFTERASESSGETRVEDLANLVGLDPEGAAPSAVRRLREASGIPRANLVFQKLR